MKIIEISIDSLGGFELEAVSQHLAKAEGVIEVTILEITGQIMVYCEDELVSKDSLLELLETQEEQVATEEINEPQEPVSSRKADAVRSLIHLRVQGMHCAGCERAIENVVSSVPGVQSVKAEVVTGRTTIGGEGIVGEEVIQAVSRAGYKAQEVTSRSNLFENIQAMHRRTERKLFGRWILAFICVLWLVLSLLIQPDYGIWWWLAVGLASVVQLLSGGPYLLSAIRLARYGQTNMDTLIALGTTAAFVGALLFGRQNDFHVLMESPMILGVVGFGKWLESVSINRAISQIVGESSSTETVMKLQQNGGYEEVPVEEISRGMRIVVRAGEQVQLDGVVASQSAVISRAWLTGESEAIELVEGDSIHAGSVNEGNNFQFVVTAEAGETRFDQIMDRLEKSIGKRPQIQQLADQVVSVFVPVLVLIACLTYAGWFLMEDGTNQAAWRYTVAVLVIACPCALGLATPVATLVSGTRGLRLGALITNPGAIEQLSEVGVFVLDKTGTLTSAHLEVVRFDLEHGGNMDHVLKLVRALEQHSTHPIAKSLIRYCDKQIEFSETLEVANVEFLSGVGISGVVDSQSIALVSDGFVVERFGVDLTQREETTRVWVVVDDTIVGMFALEAPTLPGASEVVNQLQRHCGSVEKVVMASGDNEVACQRTAAEVGIVSVFSEMSPEAKTELVGELKVSGNSVAIVGDGINDSVALAEADVGIAAYEGADIAAQSADIVLVRPGLGSLCQLIALSGITRRIIRQNLWWAFLYNILAIPLAAGVFSGFGLTLTPMIAASIMATSSTLVVLNSLRLNRISLT